MQVIIILNMINDNCIELIDSACVSFPTHDVYPSIPSM